ncbi:MAG: hypothetical protein IPK67_16390 [Planctomycetes bacterium]|nr:hypothetical protein [Planctomycetota bacterium]
MIHSHLLALVLGVVLSPIAPSTVAHSTPLLQGSPHIQAPAHVESPAAEKTVWTLDVHEPHIPKDLQPTAWGGAFHLARISFGDDGTCTASEQVERACGLLRDARKNNPNGVVALTFIHGWHHGGTWQDTHFAAFREILRKLSIREIERSKPRTVVGVYFAWNGDVQDPHLLQRGWLKNTTFSNRYKTAEGVGSGIDCRDSMRRLIDAAKSSVPQSSRAQLVMMGHSMGALVLESAFLSMLTDKSSPLGAAIADTNPQAVQTFEGSAGRSCFPISCWRSTPPPIRRSRRRSRRSSPADSFGRRRAPARFCTVRPSSSPSPRARMPPLNRLEDRDVG